MSDRIAPFMDFSGGLNTDKAPDLLQDNELEWAENVDYGLRGGLSKRKGIVPINAASYGEPVTQVFEWPLPTGYAQLMAVMGCKLYRIDEDGTCHLAANLVGDRVDFFLLQHYLYFLDGSEFYRYWYSEELGAWQLETALVFQTPPDEMYPTDIAPIRRCRYIVRHPKSCRIYAAGDPLRPAALYYSEPNDPTMWLEVSVLFPTTNDGQVTGLAVLDDLVLVFFQHSIWCWRGIDPDYDAVWEQIPVRQGTKSDRSICLTEGCLTFLGEGGIYALARGQFVNIAKEKVVNLLKQVRNHENTVAVYDAFNSRYMLAYSSVGGINDRILVYEWEVGAWCVWTGLKANDFCYRLSGELFMASDGYIYKLSEGYSDHGQPIPFHIKTKRFNLQTPFHQKVLKKVYLLFNELTAGCAIDANIILDKEVVAVPTITESSTRKQITGKSLRVQVEVLNQQDNMPVEFLGCGIEHTPVNIYKEALEGGSDGA